MFSVGDRVVYGSMGVCTIVDICIPDLPGAARECYVLTPLYVANSKIYAPVQNNTVRMRALLTPTEVQTLIDDLPQIKSFQISKERQEMMETYRSAIKSADSFILAKLIKTLYEKRLRLQEQRKTVPSMEKEYFDTAEKMLYGEIAASLQMPLGEVERYISSRLHTRYTAPEAAVS